MVCFMRHTEEADRQIKGIEVIDQETVTLLTVAGSTMQILWLIQPLLMHMCAHIYIKLILHK